MWVWIVCTSMENFFFLLPVLSIPEIIPAWLELSGCRSELVSVLNNSACLFTCSLLTLKQHPPVTLLLNTLVITTSASPLALHSCIKYWGICVRAYVYVSVSVCVCLCLQDRGKASENINTVCLWVLTCVCLWWYVGTVCVFCSHHVQCHYERHYLKKMDVTDCVALWLGYRDMTVCLSSEPVYCCLCIMILFRWIFSFCFQRLWAVYYVLFHCRTCTHCVSYSVFQAQNYY